MKCAAALGLWKVLKREGIALDMVVGCSGGSLYAASMALGYDVDEVRGDDPRDVERDVTKRRDYALDARRLPAEAVRLRGHFGMVHGGPAARRAAEGVRRPHVRRRDDSRSTSSPPTSTRAAGRRSRRARIVDAVRASIAIPYIWEPWEVDGQLLLDGCLSAPLPVDVAIKEGARRDPRDGLREPVSAAHPSATRYAFHVNSIYTNNLFRANYSFHNLAHHAEILPIVPDFGEPVNLFDTHKIRARHRAAASARRRSSCPISSSCSMPATSRLRRRCSRAMSTRIAPARPTGTILVVDDNELNRDLLSRRLRRDGHDRDGGGARPRALDRSRRSRSISCCWTS